MLHGRAEIGNVANFSTGAPEPGDLIESEMMDAVKEMDIKVQVHTTEPAGATGGYWAGVQIDPTTSVLKAGVSRGLDSGVADY